jgi:hypothetical protein
VGTVVAVGSAVGMPVGILVGMAVLATVGMVEEGVLVGNALVGIAVVGTKVGATVGIKVGGVRVGAAVGTKNVSTTQLYTACEYTLNLMVSGMTRVVSAMLQGARVELPKALMPILVIVVGSLMLVIEHPWKA